MSPKLIIIASCLLAFIVLLAAGCSSIERKLLFFPSHGTNDNGLARWTRNGGLIGFARIVERPRNVWLMLHGNAGQAADRTYALQCFPREDSVFIMEYPGYGSRKGKPGKSSFDKAAAEAYEFLRQSHQGVPICVVSESIGSGPACYLATLNPPPDKLVLIVPFDKLASVARHHVPGVLVSLCLKSKWDNVETLAKYKGPIEIFGAKADTIIPVSHAQALAASVPQAKFVMIEGGHNEWAEGDRVKIRNH